MIIETKVNPTSQQVKKDAYKKTTFALASGLIQLVGKTNLVRSLNKMYGASVHLTATGSGTRPCRVPEIEASALGDGKSLRFAMAFDP